MYSQTRARRLRKTSQSLLPVVVVLLISVEACSSDGNSESDGPLSVAAPHALVDTNEDPDIVEVQLVASSGRTQYLPDGDTEIWGYRDGSVSDSRAAVPGPLLEVKQGQRVIVHFRNELPENTTIHWHGLRVPNESDGTPSVQHEIPPQGTFDYEFIASDASTFWYHPHVRSDTQIERGLYGAVVVRGGPEIPVDSDHVFVLDDVKLLSSGELSTDTTQLDVMLGRQGNVILANGKRRGRLNVHSQARERWRFVNSSNGRYFNLQLRDHPFLVVGWDGGIVPKPYPASTLLIAPGERYEVLVDFPDEDGANLTLETVYYDRGHNVPDPGPQRVFDIAVRGSVSPPRALPDSWGEAIDLEVPGDAPVRLIKLSEQETSDDGFPRFFLNDHTFPDVPTVEAQMGEIAVWSVNNDSEMDHPFHIHGLFFRVLDVDGQRPEHDGWKDTVNVPLKQTVRLGVRYSSPGTWMYHCHILEHAERGMMAELKVLQ
ncbi:MAG: hypothetical protein RL701_6074 [Pseudomonadota bacterium]|jgi:FtsP/CotA-like multicopper oxidase with cupredoxin domain